MGGGGIGRGGIEGDDFTNKSDTNGGFVKSWAQRTMLINNIVKVFTDE